MNEQQEHLLTALDHVNIRTARVAEMVAFYCQVLGLSNGRRPPFLFGGAWLYCGEKPVVHLVEATHVPSASLKADDNLGISHFAFTATGVTGFLARLRQNAVPYGVARLPGSQVVQVNLHDPDGNALHVDFADAGDGPLV